MGSCTVARRWRTAASRPASFTECFAARVIWYAHLPGPTASTVGCDGCKNSTKWVAYTGGPRTATSRMHARHTEFFSQCGHLRPETLAQTTDTRVQGRQRQPRRDRTCGLIAQHPLFLVLHALAVNYAALLTKTCPTMPPRSCTSALSRCNSVIAQSAQKNTQQKVLRAGSGTGTYLAS
jgi:hypothetical protein